MCQTLTCHLSVPLCLDTLASRKLNDNIGDNLMLEDLSLVTLRLIGVQLKEARSQSDTKIELRIYLFILEMKLEEELTGMPLGWRN